MQHEMLEKVRQEIAGICRTMYIKNKLLEHINVYQPYQCVSA